MIVYISILIIVLSLYLLIHQKEGFVSYNPNEYYLQSYKNVLAVRPIIGYIHICQEGEWKRSLQMILNDIKQFGLYDSTHIIRLGIVNNTGILIKDPILNDSKFQIIYVGKSSEYERPTLLHMRKAASTDNEKTRYYYLHTKGLRHFGQSSEKNVIDWIKLMLYWNVENWQLAIKKLETYDIYGCNDTGNHYSGNFWWATRHHILQLPTTIPSHYTAPEEWIQIKRDNKFSPFNSGYQGMGHYSTRYSRDLYESASLFGSGLFRL